MNQDTRILPIASRLRRLRYQLRRALWSLQDPYEYRIGHDGQLQRRLLR